MTFRLVKRRPRDPLTAKPPRWVRDLARAVTEPDPQRRARLILEGARSSGVQIRAWGDEVWAVGPKAARQRWEPLILSNKREIAVIVRAGRAAVLRQHVLDALAAGGQLMRTDFGTWRIDDKEMEPAARALWRAARERHGDLIRGALALVAAEHGG